MGPFDDYENGPGYWAPDDDDVRDEAFREGAASREAEITDLADRLANAEQEIERLAQLLSGAVAA